MKRIFHPYDAICQNAENFPDRDALGALSLGKEKFQNFQMLTWEETRSWVNAYALVLKSHGIASGDRVAFQGRNQAPWVLLDWACSAIGAVSVPLYPQSISEEIDYILRESEAKIFVRDRVEQIELCREITFGDFHEKASEFLGRAFYPELSDLDELATIIYTSGTTGEPKGVMHNFRAIALAVQSAQTLAQIDERDRLLSYLPLSHVVERTICDYAVVYTGASVYFVDHVEKVAKFLPVVSPSVFAAVPRIWDLIANKLDRELDRKKWLLRGLEVLPPLLKRQVLSILIKRKLGFSKARLLASGAAKLNIETAKLLRKFGIIIAEGYGLTETFSIAAFNDPESPVFGSVGKALSGVEIKLAEDGEICIRGQNLFMGYYKKKEETEKVLKDGWFHTGDIGELDPEGRLYITDRKKDIFKTTNGKYVAPQPIEAAFKMHPEIQEVMVVGDNRPYCVAICSLNEGNFPEKDLLKILDEVNSKLPAHERIHGMAVTKRSWSVDAGELTPSMKLKRRIVLERYEENIKQLYADRKKLEILNEPLGGVPNEMNRGKKIAHSSI